MKHTICYLLVQAREQRFKIGISKNFPNRLAKIRSVWGDIDLDLSYAVTCKGISVSKIESFLHTAFHQYRIDSLKSADGHTEWFRLECLEQVKTFVTVTCLTLFDKDTVVLQESAYLKGLLKTQRPLKSKVKKAKRDFWGFTLKERNEAIPSMNEKYMQRTYHVLSAIQPFYKGILPAHEMGHLFASVPVKKKWPKVPYPKPYGKNGEYNLVYQILKGDQMEDKFNEYIADYIGCTLCFPSGAMHLNGGVRTVIRKEEVTYYFSVYLKDIIERYINPKYSDIADYIYAYLEKLNNVSQGYLLPKGYLQQLREYRLAS